MSGMGRITLAPVGAEAAAANGSAPAPFDAGAFQRTLGRFATGVTLVTGADACGPIGLIVNAFTAVSLEPPLIAICPSRHSFTWPRVRRSGRFGVNMLAAEHAKYVRHAAQAEVPAGRALAWRCDCAATGRCASAISSRTRRGLSQSPMQAIARSHSHRLDPTHERSSRLACSRRPRHGRAMSQAATRSWRLVGSGAAVWS